MKRVSIYIKKIDNGSASTHCSINSLLPGPHLHFSLHENESLRYNIIFNYSVAEGSLLSPSLWTAVSSFGGREEGNKPNKPSDHQGYQPKVKANINLLPWIEIYFFLTSSVCSWTTGFFFPNNKKGVLE